MPSDQSDLLRSPTRLPLVAPSILSADFARMGEECAEVLAQGADMLHLDVMDGHFVPNLTMGPDLCRGLRRALGPGVFLDVHLMVTDPGMYFEAFAKAGANLVTFHVELAPVGQERAWVEKLAARARGLGMGAGLAVNPPTPVERMLDAVGAVDLALVMSVNPGFSGQAFIPEVLDKTRRLRAVLRSDQRLQMDGGIGLAQAQGVREAGCDCLVAASAIFGKPPAERAGVIAGLRGEAVRPRTAAIA